MTLALLARGIFLKPVILSIVLMENLSQEEPVQRFLILSLILPLILPLILSFGIRYRSRLRSFCFV
jgi:hypothetical protein